MQTDVHLLRPSFEGVFRQTYTFMVACYPYPSNIYMGYHYSSRGVWSDLSENFAWKSGENSRQYCATHSCNVELDLQSSVQYINLNSSQGDQTPLEVGRLRFSQIDQT